MLLPQKNTQSAKVGQRIAVVAGSLLAALAGAFILYRYDPAVESFYLACPVHDLTGLLCMTCGATRALHSLLHGQILTALRQNAIVVLLLLPTIWQLAVVVLRFAADRPDLPLIQISRRMAVGLLTVALIFMVVRNFPGIPAQLLGP